MEIPSVRPCPACGSSRARLKFLESPFRVMKCAACGLVYLGNPPPEDSLYEDYYAVSEVDPADYHPSSEDPKQRELFVINAQRVQRLWALKPGGELLDVGCGRGQFLESASRAGYDIHGIDVSARAVAEAAEGFGVSAEVATLQDLIDGGRRFDVVTLWHVLEHFSDPFQTLREVQTLLNGGGVCVVEVPNLKSLKFVLSRSKWEGGNHPLYHRTFFTAASLGKALRETGFREVARKHWSYALPERSRTYEAFKRALDVLGMDAFLDFVGRK